ncbi:ATP-binding protein [Actinomadura flavalba]|uniref:ATP-binding protein n=1 Tax=Actinomadura flavalba TaxID=1120938 RepID=UPI0003788E59|nr:ATP-binding protein [Actinomadura flavalba]
MPVGPRAAAAARARGRAALADWRVTDDAATGDIVLMIDELVANAVVHGHGPVTLRLTLVPGPPRTLHAEITDHAPPPGPRTDPGPLAEHGRGLLIVAALATATGTRPAPGGKTVWFTRALP